MGSWEFRRSSYVRQWLDLPISATLSSLALPKTKYGINLILPSTKYSQCQTVIRNALKSSPNSDIDILWSQTSLGYNVQYDQNQNTKQVLNAVQKDNKMRITHELKSQGFIITSILTHESSKYRSLWSTVQQSMPKISLTILSNIWTTPLQPGRFSANGPFLSHLHAPSALKLKRFSMSSLDVQPIWNRVDIPGATNLSFSILQKLLHHCLSALYMLTYLHFYRQALLPGIPLDQILY